jgi:hypothetical protein
VSETGEENYEVIGLLLVSGNQKSSRFHLDGPGERWDIASAKFNIRFSLYYFSGITTY